MVYITAVTATFLLSFLKEDCFIKKRLQWVGFHAGAFCIGFILYWITSSLYYMEGSEYLTNQLSWGKMNTFDVILNCLRGIKHSLTNMPPYYTGMYGVFCLLLAGVSLHVVIRKKDRKYLLFLAAEAAFDAYFRDYFGDTVDMMPVYPNTGYVQYLQNDEIGLDYIVVKLGANWRRELWAEEE